MATISNGESGSSVRTKLNEIINKVEGVTSIDNNIDITGTLTSDGLTVETATSPKITISENTGTGTASLDFVATSSFPKTKITTDIAAASMAFSTIGNDRMLIASNGDISFYEDTGTTAKFFWDASAESLGIGTSSQAAGRHLTINNTTAPAQSFQQNGTEKMLQGISGVANGGVTGSVSGDYFARTSGGKMLFSTDDGVTAHATIDSSGSVGIGVVPDAWSGTGAAIQLEGTGHLATANQYAYIGSNYYYNGGWKYTTSSTAAQYRQDSGTHQWLTAASGTADAALTWSEAMRIDSSGQVGIGTSSPDAPLEIEGSGGGVNLSINNVGTSGRQYILQSTSSAASIGGGKFAIYDGDASSHRFVLDSSGNVGIGTDSPINPLHINIGTDQNLRVFSASSTATIGSLNDANTAYAALGYTGSQHEFRLGTTEAMRIDSSGNLLVGKTADNLTDAGQVFTTAGSSFTRSGGAACQFNRNTSDGEIVRLSKDGTTVGSIASRSGVVSTIILDPRTPTSSTGAGLGTTSAKIVPADTSGLTDGKSDLGDSGNRFKDLYLSGGVYLGGTGAANLLDDYEEGTWTPTVTPASGSFTTVTVNYATYVKVGGIVHVSVKYTLTTIGTGSGAMAVSGFPYTLSSGQGNIEFVGRHVNTGDLMAGQFSGSIASFQKYDGTSSTAASGVYTFMFTYPTGA